MIMLNFSDLFNSRNDIIQYHGSFVNDDTNIFYDKGYNETRTSDDGDVGLCIPYALNIKDENVYKLMYSYLSTSYFSKYLDGYNFGGCNIFIYKNDELVKTINTLEYVPVNFVGFNESNSYYIEGIRTYGSSFIEDEDNWWVLLKCSAISHKEIKSTKKVSCSYTRVLWSIPITYPDYQNISDEYITGYDIKNYSGSLPISSYKINSYHCIYKIQCENGRISVKKLNQRHVFWHVQDKYAVITAAHEHPGLFWSTHWIIDSITTVVEPFWNKITTDVSNVNDVKFPIGHGFYFMINFYIQPHKDVNMFPVYQNVTIYDENDNAIITDNFFVNTIFTVLQVESRYLISVNSLYDFNKSVQVCNEVLRRLSLIEFNDDNGMYGADEYFFKYFNAVHTPVVNLGLRNSVYWFEDPILIEYTGEYSGYSGGMRNSEHNDFNVHRHYEYMNCLYAYLGADYGADYGDFENAYFFDRWYDHDMYMSNDENANVVSLGTDVPYIYSYAFSMIKPLSYSNHQLFVKCVLNTPHVDSGLYWLSDGQLSCIYSGNCLNQRFVPIDKSVLLNTSDF